MAVLKDRGPVKVAPGQPDDGFPAWYRDNGIPATATTAAVPPQALEQCVAQTPSPNPAAGGAPMCFPLAPGEAFYSVGDAIASGLFGTARLVTALEAAYATGTVVPGQEITFARIRLVIDVNPGFAGTYTVTHPFGVDTFPGVGTGPRAVFFTEDVGATGVKFDGALGGRVGPFLRWDALAAGEALTVVNAAGNLEQYLGDPNLLHTVTGSPFSTNFLRVDVRDAAGTLVETVTQPLFTVVGKKYLLPIPTPLQIQRVTYSRDPSNTSLDVFAQASPGQQLVVSGTGLANSIMAANASSYLSHTVLAGSAAPLPATITVTNTSDAPPSVFTANVIDLVTIADAVYDPTNQSLTVKASSSDAPGGTFGAALTAAGLGPVDAAGTTPFAVGPVPPESVTVSSSAGGSATRPVRLLLTGAGVVPSANVAVNDTATTNFNTAVTFNVVTNDTIVTPVTAVVITTPPLHGTVTVGATLGDVTYTPALNYSGPDSFAYVLQDNLGRLSNQASVAVTVVFTSVAPVANPDTIVTTSGVARTVALLANDTVSFGTTLNVNSVLISALANPAAGTLVWSAATQLATFTPAAGFSGSTTATYTVANNLGQVSNAAIITINVSAAADVVNITLAQFRTTINQWRVNGTSTSTVPGTTVTIRNGSLATSPILVSGVPVVAGVFTWTSPNGAPAPSASRLILIQSTQGGSRVAAVTVRQ